VSYLVASKRSLGSIHLVHRATTILSDARASVESTTALLAKATFLRRSLTSQVRILRGVQFELESAAQGVQQEFQAIIQELDDTGARLLQCIDFLKQTKIEEAFQPTVPEHGDSADSADKQTLHDFVDDNGVESIKQAMRVAIDNVQNDQRDMNRSIQALEDDLQSINEALSGNKEGETSVTESSSEIQQLTVSTILSLLEQHAKEMAQGLESLVKHFDLCVTAIKHTEGGGEAVVLRTMDTEGDADAQDLPEAMGIGMAELRAAPAQPMNEDERVEMLQVLENDAAEVDEVVMELQDRTAEMELLLERVVRWRERQESVYADVATAFRLLEKISGRLSGYVAETARHATRWREEKAKIEDGIGGMEELCNYYANFLHAYDGLIVEVERRRAARAQMERVVATARDQIEQLYEHDRQLRLDFKDNLGEFLPSDIWTGVNTLPPRFAINRVVDDDGFEASVPELPRQTVQDALRRFQGEGEH
jgi:autophagy-related protein 17